MGVPGKLRKIRRIKERKEKKMDTGHMNVTNISTDTLIVN